MAGINTAFNVGRGRSWAPQGPQGASLSPRRARCPGAFAGPPYVPVSLLFPVIAPDPNASAATADRRIVIVSEIGDPADSDRHRRLPFPFFLPSLALSFLPFLPFLLFLPARSPRLLVLSVFLPFSSSYLRRESPRPLFRASALALPPFKSSAKAKGSSFTLTRAG